MTAIWYFLTSSGSYITNTDFYSGFLRGIQEEPDNLATDCISAFTEYNERYTWVITYTATSTNYDNGRSEKGNG